MQALKILGTILGGSLLLLASPPVAKVTSSAPFEIQGHEVNVAGVPSWPVADGDIIATRSGSATIQLREGTRVTLLEDSKVRIDSTSGAGLIIDLLAGRLRLGSLATKQVSVHVDGKPVQVSSGRIVASRVQVVSPALGGESHTTASLPPKPVSTK